MQTDNYSLKDILIVTAGFPVIYIIGNILFVEILGINSQYATNLVAIVAYLETLLAIALITQHKHLPLSKTLGQWKKIKIKYIIQGFLIGTTLYVAVSRLVGMKTIENLTVLTIVGGVIVGPCVEECYFRGCLYSFLIESKNACIAIVISAILFALFHFLDYQFDQWLLLSIWYISFGIIAGVLRYRSQSLFPSIACHVIFNALYLLNNRGQI